MVGGMNGRPQTVLAVMQPAEVQLPDDTYLRRAKVFVTDLGVVVVTQTGKEIQIAYKAPHAAPAELPDMRAAERHQKLVAITADGTLRAKGTGGCMCGIRELQRLDFDGLRALATADMFW